LNKILHIYSREGFTQTHYILEALTSLRTF